MKAARGIRLEQATMTRDALISAARALFTENGYFNTGTNQVAAKAGVTSGALYHHFSEKQKLFEAVFEAVERDLMKPMNSEPSSLQSWAEFKKSLMNFLTAAATRREIQQIMLIDGPVVLGWSRWRELEAEYGLGSITKALEAAMKKGEIRKGPVDPLAHLILACIDEAALLIANSKDPEITREEASLSLETLLKGLD